MELISSPPCTERIYGELQREEQRFVTTLEKGEALLDELLSKAKSAGAKVCLCSFAE
jgi:alanyl-tRNA synthetase